MNRTVLAVIALAVILALAGFLFYDASDSGDTIVQDADQTTPADAPAGAPVSPPATGQ